MKRISAFTKLWPARPSPSEVKNIMKDHIKKMKAVREDQENIQTNEPQLVNAQPSHWLYNDKVFKKAQTKLHIASV